MAGSEDLTLDEVLIVTRLLTDSGHRTELDEVLQAFGCDRAELEHELRMELDEHAPGQR